MKKLWFMALLLAGFSAQAQEIDLQALMQQQMMSADTSEYEAAFKDADVDGNSYLSEKELLIYQQNGMLTEKDETYKVFDANGDGKIEKQEYIAFFKKNAPSNFSLENMEQIFKDMDSNHDGLLSPEELTNYRQKNIEVQNSEIFKLIDTNNDRKISEDEFIGFMIMTKSVLGGMQNF